jgi:hypothetical protein
MLSYPKFDLRGDQGLSKIGNAEKATSRYTKFRHIENLR